MAIQANIHGRLGSDSELAYGKDGKSGYLKFRMASDSGYGENKKTDWVSVTIFGKRAESLAAHLLKGKEVLVTGVLSGREYEGKSGKGFSLDVIANDVAFVGGKGETTATQAPAKGPTTSTLDSAPF